MKTIALKHQNTGSVLLVTLVITGILGFTLASYLTMISTQNRSVARSQNWNSSIPVAEAGIEEALMHLNKNCNWSDLTREPVDWTGGGVWTQVTNGYRLSRSLGDSRYDVTIVTAAPNSEMRPAILSEGHVPTLLANNRLEPFFAAAGTANQTTAPGFTARKVRVTTLKDSLMKGAMVAKDSIDFKGNNVRTDSFDSENPAFSTQGKYDPLKARDNGDVAVNYGIINSLNIGNADVFGSVAVGPGGQISVGPNGRVGTAAWNASHTGIEPGRSRDDMNVSFPNVKDPFPNGGYSTTAPAETVTNQVITATSTTNTSASYPTGSGTIYTNTTTTTTTNYPTSGSYIGSVVTNTGYITTAALPASGTYIGLLLTNTAPVTSSNAPASGTYVGTTGTNLITVTSSNRPANGTFSGSITTNTVVTTTPDATYPAAGTYLGYVTTNVQGSGQNANSIKSYTYNRIVGYTFQQITGYSYEQIAGYSYNKINGYTYALITSYSLVNTVYTTNAVTSAVYDYVLSTSNYKLSQIGGKVLVKGNATLFVTGSVDFTGQDSILILPGASLKLYVGASSAKLSGNGVINNGGNATNFYYFGLPSNTDLHFGGNASFTGVIYAPQANFHLGGGGNNTYDFVGASMTRTVQMNGHFNFHYDESLARNGLSRGYLVNSWTEVKMSDNK